MLLNLIDVPVLRVDDAGEKRSHWSSVGSEEVFTGVLKDAEHYVGLEPVEFDLEEATEQLPEATDVCIV